MLNALAEVVGLYLFGVVFTVTVGFIGEFIGAQMALWEARGELKRLREYADWYTALDMDSLSPTEFKEIDHETQTMMELHAKGRHYDNIVRRRLRRIRAKGTSHRPQPAHPSATRHRPDE